MIGSLILAGGVAALGLTQTLAPALLAIAVASAGSLLTEVVSTTLFQRIVPDAIRGRALGTIATISTLAYAAGSLVVPIATGVVGVEPVLLASAILVAAGALVSVLLIGASGSQGPPQELLAAASRVAGLPIFAGVPEARLAAALARATELDVPTGSVVIRQGEPADRFYVILDGAFRVDQAGADGIITTLRTMGPDEVFGELGLLNGAPRSATVTATADGRLLVLEAAEFFELVAAGSDVGPRLLALHRGGSLSG